MVNENIEDHGKYDWWDTLFSWLPRVFGQAVLFVLFYQFLSFFIPDARLIDEVISVYEKITFPVRIAVFGEKNFISYSLDYIFFSLFYLAIYGFHVFYHTNFKRVMNYAGDSSHPSPREYFVYRILGGFVFFLMILLGPVSCLFLVCRYLITSPRKKFPRYKPLDTKIVSIIDGYNWPDVRKESFKKDLEANFYQLEEIGIRIYYDFRNVLGFFIIFVVLLLFL